MIYRIIGGLPYPSAAMFVIVKWYVMLAVYEIKHEEVFGELPEEA